MRSHSLEILGLEVSFKAEADPKRIERAKVLLEERFEKLKKYSSNLSKEKLLTYIALALADDYLVIQEEQKVSEQRMRNILSIMETSANSSSE